MGEVLPIPAVGDLFLDVRGGDRTMRVSYHRERAVVVVSLWAGPVCRGSFRLDAADAGRLAEFLAGVDAPPAAPAAPAPAEPGAAATAALPDPDETGDVSRSARPVVRVPRVA